MPRQVNFLLAVLVFILVMQIVIFAPENLNELPSSTGLLAGSAPTQDVEQVMRGVHSVETTEGRQEWELWAEEGVAFKNKNLWELRRVRVLLFSDDGVQFNVEGDIGKIETQTKNLQVSGNVITRSSNGYLFKTETVSYYSKQRQMESPGTVEMTGPRDSKGNRLRLQGVGLTADLKSSQMRILEKVKAQRTLPPDRNLVIHSDGAVFSGEERQARFLGNVVMDLDNMRITGPDAEFEYDSQKDLVKSIAVKGGVRVTDTEKLATAQNLKVFFEEDKFVFRGDPRVVQDSDELRGEEIVFLEGGRKVLVQRARAKVDEKSLEKVN